MIRGETTHATQGEAEQAAADFKRYWGFGYDGRAIAYQKTDGTWVCQTTRFSSCD